MSSLATIIKNTSKTFWIITGIHFLLKIFIASTIELGNDEVYYTTYARYPDFSHFDHPPLVGFIIQLFTLNLWLDADFMVRSGSIFLSIINMWLVYSFVKKYSSNQAAIYTVIAYQSSIYLSLLVGLFILPDTPQVTFWLLSIFIFSFFIDRIVEKKIVIQWKYWFLLGLTIGLSILSKYNSVFIGFGVFLFLLFFAYREFYSTRIYLLIIIVIIISFPIIYWNINHNFISFQFHTQRVTNDINLEFISLIKELFGQFIYQNPLLYVIYTVCIILFFKNLKRKICKPIECFLVMVSLPIIITFLFVSLFRETLPHWSGPGFTGLLLLSGLYFDKMKMKKYYMISWGLSTTFFIITPILVNFFPINLAEKDVENLGEYDYTQDMYGWRMEKDSINNYLKKFESKGIVKQNTGIVDIKWFPGSHVDHYIAQPLNRNFFLIGNIKKIHKYYWINNERDGPKKGYNYYYFFHSSQPINVNKYFSPYFNSVELLDTFTINRMNKPMRNVKIYHLKDFK